MASKEGMKGFYKQKKKSGGITKSSKSKSSSPYKKSNVTQPSALMSHGSLDLQEVAFVYLAVAKSANNYDQNEEMLRQFDMNMVYGPCLGMIRLDRWERAKKLGLNPPTDVEHLLRSSKVRNESLWDGHV